MSLSKVQKEMPNALYSYKRPLPPFKQHLYIGHCFSDCPLVTNGEDSLHDVLRREYEIICYSRHQSGRDQPVKERIDEGVAESQKCLLVMTENYFTDKYSNYEIQTIHRKGKRFSKDMIIVLWLDSTQQELMQSSFKEYRNISLISGNLFTTENLQLLRDAIFEPLRAQLTCLPRENVGYGAAMGYFYGFLRLVLPNFRKRFISAIEGDPVAKSLLNLRERSVKKMIIILPRSCFCPVSIKSKDRIDNVEGFFVKRVASRSGTVSRVYNTSVYKLTDQSAVDDNEREYYFAFELATPLLTMYETYHFGLSGMTMDQLYEERNVFCYTLYHILQNPDNKECNNEYRLETWDDKQNADGKYETELCDLLLPILKEELLEEKILMDKSCNTAKNAVSDLSDSANSDKGSSASVNTCVKTERGKAYESDDDGEENMAVRYERLQFSCYKLRPNLEKGKRGMALIINIMTFSLPVEFPDRLGANVDGENMQKLFENLGFDVKMYTNVCRTELENILMEYNSKDHSACDAFICCIMTHGKLGQIYTSDCKPYKILSLVDMFTPDKCKSLQGKPKLFFLQCCQSVLGYEPTNADSIITPLKADNRRYDDELEMDMIPDSNREESTNASQDPECNDAVGGSVEASGPSSTTDSNSGATSPSNPQGVSIARQVSENCPLICSICHKITSCNNPECPSIQDVGEEDVKKKSRKKFLQDEVRSTLVPGEPDILMSYSALPGNFSYRDKNEGSLYIQALAESFMLNLEIDRALKNVTKYVKDKMKNKYNNQVDGSPAEQLPFHLTTGMSKLLYLTPVKRL